MPKNEPTTPDELRELARRLDECSLKLRGFADDMDAEGLETADLAVGTARLRIDNLEGFCRNTDRITQKTITVIREDRVRYEKKRSGRKKKN